MPSRCLDQIQIASNPLRRPKARLALAVRFGLIERCVMACDPGLVVCMLQMGHWYVLGWVGVSGVIWAGVEHGSIIALLGVNVKIFLGDPFLIFGRISGGPFLIFDTFL